MIYNNKFEDGQKVVLKATGLLETVNKWSLSRGPTKNQFRYTYTLVNHPGTFYFEHELEAWPNPGDTLLRDKREE